MIDETTDEILNPESVDRILRDAIPMLVKTAGLAEHSYNELHRLALAVGTLQTALVGFEKFITDIEFRMTELESRLEVISSRVKGEAK